MGHKKVSHARVRLTIFIFFRCCEQVFVLRATGEGTVIKRRTEWEIEDSPSLSPIINTLHLKISNLDWKWGAVEESEPRRIDVDFGTELNWRQQ